MENIISGFFGVLIGYFFRDLLNFFTQLICEKVIIWRCGRLPPLDKSEAIEAMIADARTQRSLIGMIIIAFTRKWDRSQPPAIQYNRDKEE